MTEEEKAISEARIDDMINALRVAWRSSPYLRLGQLLENANGNSTIKLFYVDDKDMLKKLKGWIR